MSVFPITATTRPFKHSTTNVLLKCLILSRNVSSVRNKSTISSSGNLNGSSGAPRTHSSSPPSTVPPDQPFPTSYQHNNNPTDPPRSPVTDWVLKSPTRTSILLRVGDLLGFGSPKQVAGRRAQIIYAQCSEVASGPESAFWYDGLSLPPTFQSWFTVTNLHVWMATVRLRALPSSHGRYFVQSLIDHFFFDVEDRLRAILGKSVPERLVTRQMKILREQWNGLGVSCDVAFIAGDKEMASTMWRNLLGARGARGIKYQESSTLAPATGNPSESKTGISDDSLTGGVVDFEGPTIDRYILYPQLMLLLTSYVRREIARLETVSDRTILGGSGRGLRETVDELAESQLADGRVRLHEAFRFGSVESAGEEVGVKLKELKPAS